MASIPYKTILVLVTFGGIAFAQVNRPHIHAQVGDTWTYFGPTLGGGWGINLAFAQGSGPHLNPLIGDVWTYFGPTLGAGWGTPSAGPAPPLTNVLTGSNQTLTGAGVALSP
jgi:hypothetical protein